MSATGAFTFVLHSHLPYARLAGHWPHEVASVEAVTETYLPPTQAVYDLRDERIDLMITLRLSQNMNQPVADLLEPTWTIERFGELPRAIVDDDDDLEDDKFDDDFDDDDLDDDLDDDDFDEEDEDDFDDDPDEGDDLDD